MEMATGYLGYDSLLGKHTAGIGELLRQNGYNTAWFGKDHLARCSQRNKVKCRLAQVDPYLLRSLPINSNCVILKIPVS
jgi:arylsulfatase A-like enzyme